MRRRDASPKRGPALPGKFHCSRAEHTPLRDEWFVHKPKGSIVEVVSPDIPTNGHFISKYESKKIVWRSTFEYVADATAQSSSMYSRKQALELAEQFRESQNITHRCAVAFWRYVHPRHVEVDFPKCGDGTFIVERSYWESIRHTATFTYNAKKKTLVMCYSNPQTARIENRSVAMHHLGASAPLRVHFFDGDRQHLCRANLRVQWTALAAQNQPTPEASVRVVLESHLESNQKFYTVYAQRYHRIPNSASADKPPPSIVNGKYCTEISVVHVEGFVFWLQSYTRRFESFYADEQKKQEMCKTAEKKANAICRHWNVAMNIDN